MAQHQGVIEHISHKYDKFAVTLENEEGWYGTKKEFADEWDYKPRVGDTVVFDDGGKKYFSKHKVLAKAAGNAAPSGGSSGGRGGSLLGIEMGHASNVAKDMANTFFNPTDIGSPEWYKFFAQHTMKVYGVMHKLKDKAAQPVAVTTIPPAATEAVQVLTEKPVEIVHDDPSPFDDDEDIFG